MDENRYGAESYGMNEVALDPQHEHMMATRRVAVHGLASHAGTYVAVCTGLLIVNLLTSPTHLWAFWPAFGWGIGIVSHAAGVLGTVLCGGRTHGAPDRPSLPLGAQLGDYPSQARPPLPAGTVRRGPCS